MCPPIGGAAPQSTNPFQFDMSNLGKSSKADASGGPEKTQHSDHANNVKFAKHDSSGSGFDAGGSNKSLTNPSSLPTGDGEISAATQRLIDMAKAETKDGPAASYLGKMMIQNQAHQREAAMQDMIADRQNALSLTLAAADQLKSVGQNLEKSAVTSLALGLTGSACSFATKPKDGIESRPKIAAMGKGFSSGSEFASSRGQAESKLGEAQQKTLDAMSEQANMVADRKKDALDKIEELTKQTIEFVHDLQETNNDMMKAITRG